MRRWIAACGLKTRTSLHTRKISHSLSTQITASSPSRCSRRVMVADIEQVPAHAPLSPAWEAAHRSAVNRGEMFYEDPDTGLMVMTELVHRKRGRCCGSGCRHCPFAHESVPAERRDALNYSPTWLVPPDVLNDNNPEGAAISGIPSGSVTRPVGKEQPAAGADSSSAPPAAGSTLSPSDPRPIVVLFWSTGKDSFLALRALHRTAAGAATSTDPPTNVPRGALVVLLTTFDANTRIIAHQETSIDDAVRQARALSVPLLGVPLARGGDAAAGAASGGYIQIIHRALAHIRTTFSRPADSATTADSATPAPAASTRIHGKVHGLAFGDLHLAHVRLWRETARLQGDGEELLFPLWKRAHDDMLREIEGCSVPCVVSAVEDETLTHGCVSVGDRFGRALVDRARAVGVDPFGEDGEFHTLARVWEWEEAATA